MTARRRQRKAEETRETVRDQQLPETMGAGKRRSLQTTLISSACPRLARETWSVRRLSRGVVFIFVFSSFWFVWLFSRCVCLWVYMYVYACVWGGGVVGMGCAGAGGVGGGVRACVRVCVCVCVWVCIVEGVCGRGKKGGMFVCTS